MSTRFTDEQEHAIKAAGSFIIVSAAAGSGKTTLLIEKLIRLLSDCENRISADSLIVVTFTNDAANQIVQRLGKAFTAAVSAETDKEKKEWLIKQQGSLGAAKISTISSFCFDLIRSRADKLGISSDFRILDEQEDGVLLIKAMEETADAFLSDDDKKDRLTELFTFFDWYKGTGDKREQYDEFFRFRSFLLSVPFCKERFLTPCLKDYEKGLSTDFDPFDTVYGKYFSENCMTVLDNKEFRDAAEFIYTKCKDAFDPIDNEAVQKLRAAWKKECYVTTAREITAIHDYYNTAPASFPTAEWDRAVPILKFSSELFRHGKTRKERLDVISAICSAVPENNDIPETTAAADGKTKKISKAAAEKARKAKINDAAEEIFAAFEKISRITDEAGLTRKKGITACLSDDLKADYADHYNKLSLISEFLDEFEQRLSALKAEKNGLSFTDGELLALKLLGRLNGNKIEKTEEAEALSREYGLIMIDEFQDSNDLQDIIFRLLSPCGDSDNEGRNMFIVGDVKQSIYNFRLANPGIFMKYLDTAALYTNAENDPVPRKILLNRNFRSGENVIDFVNHIFEKIMSDKSCGVVYDDEQKLIYCGDEIWAKPNKRVTDILGDTVTEILLVDSKNRPFSDEAPPAPPKKSRTKKSEADDGTQITADNPQKSETVGIPAAAIPETADDTSDEEEGGESNEVGECRLEAEAVALKIKTLINKGLEPRDICILCIANSDAPYFAEALQRLGIKASVENNGKYTASREISLMLDILKILDNPHNNIALMGALMSPVFTFDADDAAVIAAVRGRGSCYAAVRAAADGKKDIFEKAGITVGETERVMEKSAAFAELYDALRLKASVMGLEDIIREIYRKTNIEELMSLYPNGGMRRANLDLLPVYAAAYEKNSLGGASGIYGFIRYTEVVSENSKLSYGSGSASSESDNAVAIKTIHKSKGLEYPVVFLCRANKSMPVDTDILYYTSDRGAGFTVKDSASLTSYSSLPAEIIYSEKYSKLLNERMRLMYVAMTRAKVKLFISGVLNFGDNKTTAIYRENAVMSEDEKYKNFECDITECCPDGYIQKIMESFPSGIIRDSGSAITLDGCCLKFNTDKMLYMIIAALAAEETVPYFTIPSFTAKRKKQGKTPVKVKALRADRELAKTFFAAGEKTDRRSVSDAVPDKDMLTALEKLREYDSAEQFSADRERSTLPAKLTVTEITRSTADGNVPENKLAEFLPSAIKEYSDEDNTVSHELTAAQRGTAVHAFMQYADLRQLARDIVKGGDPIGAEARRLNHDGLIDECEAEYIDGSSKIKRRIARFFTSELWTEHIMTAEDGDILTEQPFMAKFSDFFDKNSKETLDLRLKKYYNDNYSDTFVQGIADLIVKTEDGFILVDYKTNEGKTLDELKNMYSVQLLLYTRIFEKIYELAPGTGKAYIYSFGTDGSCVAEIK